MPSFAFWMKAVPCWEYHGDVMILRWVNVDVLGLGLGAGIRNI
jgi:hypothetical protein